MAAAYQEIFLEKGTDFNISITVDDIDGVPFDLTNFTAKSQIKKSYYSTSPAAEFVVTFDADQTDGVILLSMDAATTANVAPGRYVYDVLIKNNHNNTVTRIVEGIVNVTPQVTVF